ncbi:MAG: DUF362 domain-containing protein [Bryobacterales bacterium]|nr:DUF362 domain-containing protein [Bryobacterales bacterium]
MLNRREFLSVSAGALGAASLEAAPSGKSRVGFVHSTHSKLVKPAPPEDLLSYEQVREMVWRAIEYGKPKAGSLEAKIRPGSWVVIKPNYVFLRPQGGYRTGDVTDLRVTRAVLEYVARKAKAGRITIAEGGSYRTMTDTAKDNVVTQNGRHVNAYLFDWGPDEFPGTGGSIGDMLKEFGGQFPRTRFDYADLSYDAVRDASGKLQRIEVPRTKRGVGAFGERPDYYVTNTITKCDFLISVPVMKVHEQCGVTACFKNYVGTAPREAYANPGQFHNANLHRDHSLDGRIDSFIVDLAAFHPPDYNVIDGLRGLQYTEHNNRRPDQTVQTNVILAGEDTVANDAVVAKLIGFNPWDIEFLHMASQRDLGQMDLGKIDVIGDDPGKYERRWIKPRMWWGRCNREWRVSRDPNAPASGWERVTVPTDTLRFAKYAAGADPKGTFAAAARVQASGNQKGYLWVGVRGRVTVTLNGETVMEDENVTRYRVGQFQKPVELKPGENRLVFQVQSAAGEPMLSALLVNQRNDGDSLEGIRWMA